MKKKLTPAQMIGGIVATVVVIGIIIVVIQLRPAPSTPAEAGLGKPVLPGGKYLDNPPNAPKTPAYLNNPAYGPNGGGKSAPPPSGG